MAAATHAVTAEKQRHLSVVQPDGRAGFGALRAELHARTEDKDLAELWADLKLAERKAVAGSAGMEAKDALRSIESLGKHDRDAIRAAIGRMSRYAQRLRQQLETSAQPSCQMARNARQALLEDDRQAALHWLNLIEQGAQ
ncbi:hypothetical protein [Salinicola socius]|uniref:Uncharacterized protein n=1 Tax=Salinicola socius TaxID=404433 RepID=A0A1Q8SUJ8_9GAMM|nr:hypothetical protein [Salinicola socius]OLO05086.1 hypothetical protein BTW07_05590 [Salinicola socius]